MRSTARKCKLLPVGFTLLLAAWAAGQTRPVAPGAQPPAVEKGARARELVQEGDRAMQAGEYARAVEAFAQAIRTLDNDTDVWLKLGDAHFGLTYFDVARVNKARNCWEQAIAKNPSLLPARRKLLNFWVEWANANTGGLRAKSLAQAGACARDLLRLSSGDKQARFAANWAVVELWIMRELVDQRRLDEAIRELRKLQTEDPDNAEVHYAVARAQVYRGMELLRAGHFDEGQSSIDSGVKTMEQAARRYPNNAAFAYRRVQLLLLVGPRLPKSPTSEQIREKTQEFNSLLFTLAERARAFGRPDDKEYEAICVTAALMAKRAGRMEDAEKIYRELLVTNPDSALGRVHLSELMRADGKDRLDEALAILVEPRKGTPPTGVPGVVARDAERRALIAATDIRLEQYSALLEKSDPAAGELLSRVEADLKTIAETEPESARYLKLVGKKQLFQSDPAASARTLERALKVSPGPGERLHFEILFLLGRACQLSDQPGNAEKYFGEILKGLDYPPARYELTRLLIARNALDEARQQLEQLRKTLPVSPELDKLEQTLKEKSKPPEGP